MQLSPEEGGIVQEKVVEEGAQVKKGDVIIRLSNSNLDLQILDAEAQLAEKQNFLRNTQVTMEQDKLNNQLEKAQLDVDMTRYRRAYNQQKKLYEENLIAKEEFLKAKEDFELASKKYDLVVERLRQDSISRTIQMDEMETSLSNMRKNIALVHERKEHLNVRSQIDGELGLLDVVLGQNVSAGQKIGQINDLSDYKIEALIRSGQTYYINLELGQPTESIIIPRGTFFQSTGGSWIFVLDKDGKKAYRRKIKIGRQNPQYYEVIDGLEAGEKVIVSSYESYKDNEVLVLE